MFDDDPNSNVGVHNMSNSPDSERNMDEDDVHDGTIKTKGQEVKGLKMVDGKVRNAKDKDKLITTPSGEIVRRENYVIPRNQRWNCDKSVILGINDKVLCFRSKTRMQKSSLTPEKDLKCAAPKLTRCVHIPVTLYAMMMAKKLRKFFIKLYKTIQLLI